MIRLRIGVASLVMVALLGSDLHRPERFEQSKADVLFDYAVFGSDGRTMENRIKGGVVNRAAGAGNASLRPGHGRL